MSEREWRDAAVRAARAAHELGEAIRDDRLELFGAKAGGREAWAKFVPAVDAFARLDRGQRAREATERKVDGGG